MPWHRAPGRQVQRAQWPPRPSANLETTVPHLTVLYLTYLKITRVLIIFQFSGYNCEDLIVITNLHLSIVMIIRDLLHFSLIVLFMFSFYITNAFLLFQGF